MRLSNKSTTMSPTSFRSFMHIAARVYTQFIYMIKYTRTHVAPIVATFNTEVGGHTEGHRVFVWFPHWWCALVALVETRLAYVRCAAVPSPITGRIHSIGPTCGLSHDICCRGTLHLSSSLGGISCTWQSFTVTSRLGVIAFCSQ